jgi:hypothetical protein
MKRILMLTFLTVFMGTALDAGTLEPAFKKVDKALLPEELRR